jgi:hypothetical protein
VAWVQILALIIPGASAHHVMIRPAFLLPMVSNPLISLLAALLMLLVFGWGIWKLSR